VTALAAGAARVEPVQAIEEALQWRAVYHFGV